MAKVNKTKKTKSIGGVASRPINPADAVVYRLDAVAYEVEVKWGMDVLWHLADPALAGKFRRALDKLDEAILSGDYEAILTNVENCIKGWRAMDASATKNGYVPENVTCRKTTSPNGCVYIFCDTELDARRYLAQHPQDTPVTFSIQTVAAILERTSLMNNLSNEELQNWRPSELKGGSMPNDTIPF